MADTVELEINPKIPTSAMQGIKDKFSQALGGAVGAAKGAGGGSLAGAMPQLSALTGITDAIGKFVELANPAIMGQLSMVMDDISGVVGQTLVPVMQLMVPLLRTYADAIATILPSQEQMSKVMESFQPYVDNIREAFEKVAPAIGLVIEEILNRLPELIKLLVEVQGVFLGELSNALLTMLPILAELADMFLNVVVPAMEVTVKVVTETIKYLMSMVNEVLSWIGKNGLDITSERSREVARGNTGGRGLRNSTSAATRGAQYVGLEDLGRGFRLDAMSMKQDAMQKTADGVAQLVSVGQEINNKLQGTQSVPGFTGNNT